ncbi:MAG: MBL fold metallo-hydrolase [Patescibacteria group bacterium]|nr:MAG: MBL fold metallo-hydrolase [Patescibacteria group bacterium]
MTITYHGHSTFKIKGRVGTVVTDPYDDYIGLILPKMSTDIATVSHDHKDHNAVKTLVGTARRNNPFIVTDAGEYEVGGISVFGVQTHHDANGGVERGKNMVFTILVDGIRVCHLGDLGHELSPDQLEEIGEVDVLLCPVGGTYTIDPELAVKTIRAIEPSIVIPMHYKTAKHNPDVFGDLKTLEDFLKVYGVSPTPVAKLELASKSSLPEETELVVLSEV